MGSDFLNLLKDEGLAEAELILALVEAGWARPETPVPASADGRLCSVGAALILLPSKTTQAGALLRQAGTAIPGWPADTTLCQGSLARALSGCLIETDLDEEAAPAALDAETGSHEALRSHLAMAEALRTLSLLGLREWVAAFLPWLVDVRRPGGFQGRYSVSGPELPALGCFDASGDLVSRVESLVHEASHQAVYLTEMATSLVSRVVEAPSPFRKGPRTLRRVLVGVHAFGNSLLALRAMAEQGGPHGARAKQRADALVAPTRDGLAQVEGDASLTAEGRRWAAQMRDALGQELDRPRRAGPARGARIGRPDPWRLLGRTQAWFSRSAREATSWQLSPQWRLPEEGIRHAVVQAAEAKEAWLLHPAAIALAPPEHTDHEHLELQLLAQLAAQRPDLHALPIHLPRPMTVWSAGGSVELPAGEHVLGALTSQDRAPGLLAIDPWSECCGDPVPDGWNRDDLVEGRLSPARRRELHGWLQAEETLRNLLPEITEWAASVTRLVVPLVSSDGRMRSGCSKDVPGRIMLTLSHGGAETLELLVHESAHLHLMLEEVEAPLVEPMDEARYASPLRPDPRPLRGILLAWHALGFMTRYYEAAIRAGLAGEAEHAATLATLRQHLRQAGAVLALPEAKLTEAGRDFVARHAPAFQEM